jgi:hypothetical protein
MLRPEIEQLFKYRVFNSNSIKCLTDDVVWVSDPKNFNDPFEYTFHIESDLTYEATRLRYRSATRANYLERQREFIESLKSKFLVGGILSLSESNTVSLMWSHYADSHKGFCIGYERSGNNLLGSDKCLPVSYSTFPEMKLSEFFETLETRSEELGRLLFERMVLSKDPNWRYEREWRVLFHQSDQLIKLGVPVRSITFGLRMPDEHKDEIRSVLRGSPGIEYYQAHKAKRSYDVEVHRVVVP